jgi:hypothetical protein
VNSLLLVYVNSSRQMECMRWNRVDDQKVKSGCDLSVMDGRSTAHVAQLSGKQRRTLASPPQ